MKLFHSANIAGLGALLLTLGSAPGALSGQDHASKVSSQAKSESSVASSTSNIDRQCAELRAAAEQFARQARIIQKETQGNLALLQDRLETEGVMSSPQLAKLQALSAQFAGKEDELQSGVRELTAQAQELASQAQQDQEKVSPLFTPRQDLLMNSDDSGGYLGVEIEEVNSQNAKDLKLSAVRGVIVKDVQPDSPAAKAGLKENDVISQYDGQIVEGTVQFRRLVRETPPGRTVSLTISRDGVSQNLSAEMGDRSSLMQQRMQGMMRDFGGTQAFVAPKMDFHFAGPETFAWLDSRAPVLGISAEDLSGQLGSYFGAPNDQGVLVREVQPDTPAGKAGLKAGDVIVSVDGSPVRSLSDLRNQLREKAGEKPVSLGIIRKGASMSVAVTVEKPRLDESMQMLHRAQL